MSLGSGRLWRTFSQVSALVWAKQRRPTTLPGVPAPDRVTNEIASCSEA